MPPSSTKPELARPFWLFWAASPRRALLLSTAVASLVLAAALGLNGLGNLGWHAATRATAVFAYPFWLLAFTASSLVRLAPGSATRAIRARRRAIGLAFAGAQTVHGMAILCLARSERAILEPSLSSIGGGAGFLVIWAMAATSTDAAVRRMGQSKWRLLHGYGQVHLAIVYLATYGGRVAEQGTHWAGLIVLLAALALRATAYALLRLRSRTLPTE